MARDITDTAFGVIETRGLVAAIEAAHEMVDVVGVTLIGRRNVGTLVTAVIEGTLAAVCRAVDVGAKAAESVGELISAHVIHTPCSVVSTMLSSCDRLLPPSPIGTEETALGMIETRGLVAAIEAADKMNRVGNVTFIGEEHVGDLVTVMVCGVLSRVRLAIDEGAEAAQRVSEVVAAHVIPTLNSTFFGTTDVEDSTEET